MTLTEHAPSVVLPPDGAGADGGDGALVGAGMTVVCNLGATRTVGGFDMTSAGPPASLADLAMAALSAWNSELPPASATLFSLPTIFVASASLRTGISYSVWKTSVVLTFVQLVTDVLLWTIILRPASTCGSTCATVSNFRATDTKSSSASSCKRRLVDEKSNPIAPLTTCLSVAPVGRGVVVVLHMHLTP